MDQVIGMMLSAQSTELHAIETYFQDFDTFVNEAQHVYMHKVVLLHAMPQSTPLIIPLRLRLFLSLLLLWLLLLLLLPTTSTLLVHSRHSRLLLFSEQLQQSRNELLQLGNLTDLDAHVVESHADFHIGGQIELHRCGSAGPTRG